MEARTGDDTAHRTQDADAPPDHDTRPSHPLGAPPRTHSAGSGPGAAAARAPHDADRAAPAAGPAAPPPPDGGPAPGSGAEDTAHPARPAYDAQEPSRRPADGLPARAPHLATADAADAADAIGAADTNGNGNGPAAEPAGTPDGAAPPRPGSSGNSGTPCGNADDADAEGSTAPLSGRGGNHLRDGLPPRGTAPDGEDGTPETIPPAALAVEGHGSALRHGSGRCGERRHGDTGGPRSTDDEACRQPGADGIAQGSGSGTHDTRGSGSSGGRPPGGGLTRRGLGGRLLALSGVLLLQGVLPGAAGAAGNPAERRALQGLRLRYGSARQAGLLERHLEQVAEEARRFLGPSPLHPYYAGAVVLAGRGRTIALHRAMGDAVRYADYDGRTDLAQEFPAAQRIAMAEDTVFDLASLTKLFTSLLAVQQIERGHLELEAPVDRYLPEFTGGGKELITVRQLLTHTSGLRSWAPFYQEPTRAGQLRLLWSVRPQEPPGTVYRYSDLNLITLQLLLERITGHTLDLLLQDEITAPLGMHRTRYNPPLSWRRVTAATEVQRPPWSGLDRGLVWGRVHDENAYALGGVAGHAGIFSTAWDLAVLARTLLDGGIYAGRRILRPASVELLFTDFNTAFPNDDHGLGFELYQHWYMGAMATPQSAGHTGFTGTSLVLDPSTDSFLILLGNSVHPVRTWRAGSAPRVAVGNRFARAVPVRTRHGGPAWFSGMEPGGSGTLTLPPLTPATAEARLGCAVWWDTVPGEGAFHLEASADGTVWQPLPFHTLRTTGGTAEQWPQGRADGWSGRIWHRLEAPLTAWAGRPVHLRFRHTATGRYVGRGVYVDVVRVSEQARLLFSEDRPTDAAALRADGWTRSSD